MAISARKPGRIEDEDEEETARIKIRITIKIKRVENPGG
jgi:hypothetical protein